MTAINHRAVLTASLLVAKHSAHDRGVPVEEAASILPFAAKGTATTDPFRPRSRGALDLPPSSGRTTSKSARISLRMTPAQRWRMRLVAAVLRQSCQTLIADAIDQRIEEIARDPANSLLRMLLASADTC